jgi:peptide/nickel transport system permease protein
MSVLSESDRVPSRLGTDPDPPADPVPGDVAGSPLVEPQPPAGADALIADEAAPALRAVRSQTYVSLVWRRFRRNTLGMIGAAMVALLMLVTIFADFLSPYDPIARNPDAIYSPPQRLNFFGDDGFHVIPFTHPMTTEIDANTFAVVTTEDRAKRCQPVFLGRGWSYRFFGIALDRHLLTPPPGCPWNIIGTDRDGRDVLSRLLVGSQLTIAIALIVVAVSVTFGSLIGVVSGYFGGLVDHWIQRGVEFALALPEVPFLFALVAIVPRNLTPIQLVLILCAILASLRWAQLAREVRGKTLAIGQLDYVAAAEAVGASRWRIVVRHILPNVMSHVVVATTLLIPSIILIESFLSFLGLGVQPPMISWGLLLNAAQNIQNLGSYPWVLSPVVAVLVAVMGFNMLGDGLRDAIDPYQH